MEPATPLPADPRPGTRALVDTALGVLGIELLDASAERVEARMPVDGSIVCRGLLLVVAETVASTAAGLAAGEGRRAFGAELDASFVAQPAAGVTTSVATPLVLLDDRHVWRIEVRDATGAQVLEARCTLSVVDAHA
jgi:uncharacterized protein (TIGR00369 family)